VSTPSRSPVLDRAPSPLFYERLDFWGLVFALTFAAAWWWRPAFTCYPLWCALSLTLRPLVRAWKGSEGLPLRPAAAWAFVAIIFAFGVGMAGIQGKDGPLDGGLPVAGHHAYLWSLATIAALISTLGARTPGSGAWTMLMGLLVLVFLIPWIEDFGLRGRASPLGHLRLDAPWSIFYGLLVLAGVTNYLFTRYAIAATLVGAGLVVEFFGVFMTSWPPSRRGMLWSVGPLLGALGIMRADWESRKKPEVEPGLPSLWLWFRDHWGVVWALRVRERFQRAAEAAGWPVRLGWSGVTDEKGGPHGAIPPEALRTLEGLLRRFAPADRLAAARGEIASSPCPPEAATRE
jgi:hypothetical protein